MGPVATTIGSARQQSPLVQGDRWVLWQAVATIAAVGFLTLACGLPGSVSFWLILLSPLIYVLAGLGLLAGAVVPAARRQPRKAASALIALVAPVLLWTPINWADDYLHLGLTAGFGAGQIGSTPTGGSQFSVYDWSTGLAGGPSTFLIHDVTDDIALPLPMHKHPIALENGFGEECAGKVRHLLGHYYVCTF